MARPFEWHMEARKRGLILQGDEYGLSMKELQERNPEKAEAWGRFLDEFKEDMARDIAAALSACEKERDPEMLVFEYGPGSGSCDCCGRKAGLYIYTDQFIGDFCSYRCMVEHAVQKGATGMVDLFMALDADTWEAGGGMVLHYLPFKDGIMAATAECDSVVFYDSMEDMMNGDARGVMGAEA